MRTLLGWLTVLGLGLAACGDDATSGPPDDGGVSDETSSETETDVADVPPGDAETLPDVPADDAADVPCDPHCDDGRICGAPDDCGGVCRTGWCVAGSTCEAGACVCDELDCFGTCCGAGEVCAGGACCLPDCGGRSCGLDERCGAPCGTCDEGICDAGACAVVDCVPEGPTQVARPYRLRRAALAVDSSGLPHLLYSGDALDWDGSYRVAHAVYAAGAWTREIIDTVDQWGASFWADADRRDRIHAGYVPFSTEGGPPRYATNASGTWTFAFPDLGGEVSFAADRDGHPHFFYSGSSGGWYHATDAGGTWSAEPTEIRGGDCAFAVDDAGHVHVACLQGVCDMPRGYTETLVYQTDASGSWASSNVTDLDDCRLAGSIALAVDGAGAAHLLFTDIGIRYATNAGGSWVVEIVEPANRGALAIDTDRTGRAHLFYGAAGRALYAVRGATGWRTDVVDGGSGAGEPVVRTDGIGRAHLLYSVEGSGDSSLLYAVRCP